ncbi:hypothetical protein D3C81_2267590 [compost metagenome]
MIQNIDVLRGYHLILRWFAVASDMHNAPIMGEQGAGHRQGIDVGGIAILGNQGMHPALRQQCPFHQLSNGARFGAGTG